MWAWILIALAAVAIMLVLAPVFAFVSLVVLITGIVGISRGSRTWLRFRSRSSAVAVTAVAAVVLLATGGVANAMIGTRGQGEAVAFAEPAQTSAASVSPLSTPTGTPTPTPTPTAQAATLIAVVDGDTIKTDAGTVRLIGIDTPEQGVWGYAESTVELTAFLATGSLTLVAVPGRDDVDRYGRLLRYVRAGGQDAGLHMIDTGWAIARYDGRDGYGAHPLQADYIALDDARPMPSEPAPAPAPAPAEPAPAEPVPFAPAPAPAEPAPAEPAPATDPRFGTCREANANGYGDYQQGVNPEYNWYQDRDHDGWVCER